MLIDVYFSDGYVEKQREFDIKEADKYIKRIIPDAVYYTKNKNSSLIFYEASQDKKEQYTVIKGKKYESIISNSYEELIKFYHEDVKNRGYEQLSLF